MDKIIIVTAYGALGPNLEHDINREANGQVRNMGPDWQVVSASTTASHEPNRPQFVTLTCTMVFRKK